MNPPKKTGTAPAATSQGKTPTGHYYVRCSIGPRDNRDDPKNPLRTHEEMECARHGGFTREDPLSCGNSPSRPLPSPAPRADMRLTQGSQLSSHRMGVCLSPYESSSRTCAHNTHNQEKKSSMTWAYKKNATNRVELSTRRRQPASPTARTNRGWKNKGLSSAARCL